MDALRKARTIWSKTAQRSKEAAHATMVLEEILSEVSQLETGAPAARPSPTNAGERFAASAAETTASTSSRDRHSAEQARWSAVNTSTPPEKAPLKSYSMRWDFGQLDDVDKRKDHTLSGVLDGLLSNDTDWVS